MSRGVPTDNQRPLSQVAMLKNVTIITEAMESTMRRPAHLPGLVVFSGYSGLGKTHAAIFVAHAMRAYHVQMKSVWTRKSFLLAIAREMGVTPANTITELLDQIGERLAMSRRPLIIDEADHAVDRGLVEIIRDIYESSAGGTILLIGEEGLPGKLQKWERVHNRVMAWPKAQPLDWEDTQLLAAFYCPQVRVGDDLLRHILEASRGVTRRVAVNLERVREVAVVEGLEVVGLREWGDRPIYTADPPASRGGLR